MRWGRWLVAALVVATLAALVAVGSGLLDDRRIRLRSLITLDPPPAPVVVETRGVALAVTGALLEKIEEGAVVLRAWAPSPALRVLGADVPPRQLTVRIENLPLRVRLSASGPVEEARAGLARTLRFSADATRHLGFVAPSDQVTFAVLGDTGDSPTFVEAIRVAAGEGADFFLLAGDLVYEDEQIPNIERILTTAGIPVFVVRGNHDYRTRRRIDFMRALGPPYYTFRMGGATFIALDNGGDYLPYLWRRSTQYRWWSDRLGEPREGPLFVVMHKPPFDRRTGPRYAPMLDKAFAGQLIRDFRRAGVDAVFTGHVHETHLWVEDGIPYFVNGEGSESRTGPDRQRMALARVRGWEVAVRQVPIWQR